MRLSVLLVVVAVLLATAEAKRQHSFGNLVLNQKIAVQDQKVAAAPAQQHDLKATAQYDVLLAANVGTVFIGQAISLSVFLSSPVPEGSDLTVTATGNGRDVASIALEGGAEATSFNVTPSVMASINSNGQYSIEFTVTGASAANYNAPVTLVVPLIATVDVLLFKNNGDNYVDVTGGCFNYVFTQQTTSLDVYLGVPVPWYLDLTLTATSTDGTVIPVTFGAGAVSASLDYTPTVPSGIYTMSFAVSGGAAPFYVAPPSFDYVVFNCIDVALINAQTELYLDELLTVAAYTQAPVPKSENFAVDMLMSTNSVSKTYFKGGSVLGNLAQFSYQRAGVFLSQFSLANSEFHLKNCVELPIPFYYTVFNASRTYQITIGSSPTTVIVNTTLGFSVDLHLAVPDNTQLNVIATGSDGRTYTLPFLPGEISKAFEIRPMLPGPFTLTFALSGNAAIHYKPPPFTAFNIVPRGQSVTLRGAETSLTLGEVIDIIVNTDAPIPPGTSLIVGYKTDAIINNPAAVIFDQEIEIFPGDEDRAISFYAGDVSGTYQVLWYLKGTAAQYFIPPPQYGISVLPTNYDGQYGAQKKEF